MKKKIAALILGIVIAVNCSGCALVGVGLSGLFSYLDDSRYQYNDFTPQVETDSSYNDLDSDDIAGHKDYEKWQLSYGYQALQTPVQQDCYRQFKANVYNVSNTAYDSGSYDVYDIEEVFLPDVVMEEEEICLVMTAFTEDYPEIFWLLNTFSYETSSNGTYVYLYSYFSGEALTEMIPKFNTKLQQIVAGIPQGLNEYELELYIHDYILDNCVYDDESAESNIVSYYANSTYGAIVLGKAVCEGYAEAFTLLLSYVGIECVNVTGYGEEELHLWSAVNINDAWYYVDITWNDSEEDDGSRYDYFNITTEQLLYDHTIAGLYEEYTVEEIVGTEETSPVYFNVMVPKCTSKAENYHQKNSVRLESFTYDNDTEIINRLYNTALEQGEYMHILVDTDKITLEDALDWLFSVKYKYFDYLDSVNRHLDSGYIIDEDGVSTLDKENISVITVFIQYI